jgi:ppGpp synthetase/RelA/SpoT-type nucleotidyltranferase
MLARDDRSRVSIRRFSATTGSRTGRAVFVGSMIVDLNGRPRWSNNALRRLGVALRDGIQAPTDCPTYAEVVRWYSELAVEVQAQIERGNWSIASELLITSRAKTEDTLVEKLRRQPNLQLNTIQDLAGVRVDADILLAEQTALAREIADHFGADESAIHDLRDNPHAGYRAVHIWLRLPAGRIEIQIRTLLQSAWANTYELLADVYGRGIRYGEPIEQSPIPGVDAAQIRMLVQAAQAYSAHLAMHEARWQELSAIEDPSRRATALAAASRTKAKLLAALEHMLDGATNTAQSEGKGG